MRRRLMMLGLISLMVVLTLGAACSSDDADPTATTASNTVSPTATTASSGGGGAGGTLSVITTDLAFDSTALTVSAGSVTVNVTNNGQLPHDFTIDSPAIMVEVVSNGASASGTVTLSAGEYTFYCSVPGHRGAGMEGTLTVS